MSIASEITALTTDRDDIRTALVNKGVSAASSHGFDDFAADIGAIPTTGSSGISITNPIHGGTRFMTYSATTFTYSLNEEPCFAFLLLPDTSGTHSNSSTYGYGWKPVRSGVTGYLTSASLTTEANATFASIRNGDGGAVSKYTSIDCKESDGGSLRLSKGSGLSWVLTRTAADYQESLVGVTVVTVVFIGTDGKMAIDWVNLGWVQGCFTSDTLITLADGTVKCAGDIEYSDLLKVWDFDNGMLSAAEPLWIKKVQTAQRYQLVRFASGRTIKFVGPDDGNCHRMFCMETESFEYAPQIVGKHVVVEGGVDILESWRWVEEPVEFTNIVTNFHMNLYANGILTSCRRNNLYPVKDMTFVRDSRRIRDISEYDNIPVEMYNGLRLGEQTSPIEEINGYVGNMIDGMKR